ncbi:MAG: ABC transporter ATP-binding protein [Lachnospiraceae bacterium]|nr:ABC transporter ATP-binding protein [Lachnospiraceae bacterium]
MGDKMLLELNGISKTFAVPTKKNTCKYERKQVLENLNLYLKAGEFVVLLGPSGCGKSTLIHMIAGFELPDEGKLLLEGKPISGPSSKRGLVFQKPVLFPWLTVAENLAFGLKRNKVPKAQREELIQKYLHLVQMDGYGDYYGAQLSGGMQQRIALARTLILHPQILLMDEPFSALDPLLRYEMQKLVLSIQQELAQTILMVTHDIEEALLLADRIYILGSCPTGIVQEIVMDKKNHDTNEFMLSHEFLQYKNDIMKTFLQCTHSF